MTIFNPVSNICIAASLKEVIKTQSLHPNTITSKKKKQSLHITVEHQHPIQLTLNKP
ncbi:hypothetical protein HanRHA438_Chr15g0686861 [Helianthus annuus]|nr:hypothetical protein HanRHA438_Chr15g0686861 [Helianthus annuus]